MDEAPVLLFCPKPCCKLSFSGFLPSAYHIGINANIDVSLHIKLFLHFLVQNFK